MIDEEEIFAEILTVIELGFEIRIQMRQLNQGNFYEIVLTDFRDGKIFTAVGLDLEIKKTWERVKMQFNKAVKEGRYHDWKNPKKPK